MAVKKLDIADVAHLHIAVLCGGVSSERDVSLESGANICAALRKAGLQADTVILDDESLSALDGGAWNFCVVAMHGGFGEDGGLQQLLKKRNLPYTGSGPEACAYAMDKVHTKLMVEGEGVPVPEYISIDTVKKAREMVEDAGMQPPLVVKPVRNGSSVAVTMVNDWAQLVPAVEAALAVDETALIEERIIGLEVTAGILGDQVLPLIQIRPKTDFLDFDAKYKDGLSENICPAPIPDACAQQIREYALTSFRTLGGEHFTRADFMLDADNQPYLLELNMIPGMTTHSFLPMAAKEAGISYEALCVEMVRMGWQRHQKQEK